MTLEEFLTSEKLLKDTEKSAKLSAIITQIAVHDDWDVMIMEGMMFATLSVFCGEKGLDVNESIKRIARTAEIAAAGKETK